MKRKMMVWKQSGGNEPRIACALQQGMPMRIRRWRQNNVTTAALGRMVDDLLNIPNDGKSYGNQRYSDNAGYLGARFSIASQNAVNRLMSGYYSKQPFDFYVIAAYDLKLRKLWTFVLGANGGADPIGLHWWIYSALD